MDFEWAKEKHYEDYDLYRTSASKWIWKSRSTVLFFTDIDKDEITARFTLGDLDAKDWKIVEPEFDISKNVMTVKDPKPHVEGMVDVIEVSGFKEYIRLVKDRLDKMSSDDDASAVLDLYGGDKI